jgi:transposase-like protein
MSILAPPMPVRRPKGRPKAGSTRQERQKHIRCTGLLLSGNYTPEGVAALHGVTVRTIYRWRDLALGYDDPEAEGLRRLAGKAAHERGEE